jgi:hypothetical protein
VRHRVVEAGAVAGLIQWSLTGPHHEAPKFPKYLGKSRHLASLAFVKIEIQKRWGSKAVNISARRHFEILAHIIA